MTASAFVARMKARVPIPGSHKQMPDELRLIWSFVTLQFPENVANESSGPPAWQYTPFLESRETTVNRLLAHESPRVRNIMLRGVWLAKRLSVLPLLILLMGSLPCIHLQADEAKMPAASSGQSTNSVSIQMRQGGIGRFRPDHWGLVKGLISNKGDSPATCLTVVTPEGSEGLQFARRLTLPGKVAFETNWPAYIREARATGGIEFQYLFFPDGQDDGVIRREAHSSEIPSFSGVTQFDLLPLCGLIGDSGKTRDADTPVYNLLGVMRFSAFANKSVTSFNSADITAAPECLDTVEQIAVTDPELISFPQACEALRAWVLRGGRLMIAADRTGPAVVEALLGDSLPMTFVGETTTNTLTLEINPEYPQAQYAVRSVSREYPDPVRYLRVIPEQCENIWTVDGWPVAMTKSLGRGSVLVTTISAQVFYDSAHYQDLSYPHHALIASTRRMQEVMFTKRRASIIEESTASDQAAALIGYRIPSRNTALGLLAIFPVGMLIAGLLLQKRAAGERLIFAVPALAIVAAVPAAMVGFQIRNIAPPTVIETVVINSSPGFTDLPADGFASVFVPSPRDLGVSAENGTRLNALKDTANSDYRRMTWEGSGEVSWGKFLQPAGLRTYSVTSTRRTTKPWRVRATLNESGLTGTLPTDDGMVPEDAILVGMNRENMALDANDAGQFKGSPDQTLLAGQYFRSTLLSDDERYRTALLNSVFNLTPADQDSVFPSEPSVLFWDKSDSEVLHFGGDDVRRQRAVLVVHPLELYPPEVGTPFLIPPQLLTYRSVVNQDGGIGSSYINSRRKWQPQESASKSMLEFHIPEACRPLIPESGELNLLIRAGSRSVTITSGDRTNMQTIAELKSPLGMQTVSIPGELIRSTCLQGNLFLQIQVSDIDSEMNADDMTGEQDDSWQIERVLLTLRGQRKL